VVKIKWVVVVDEQSVRGASASEITCNQRTWKLLISLLRQLIAYYLGARRCETQAQEANTAGRGTAKKTCVTPYMLF
jgi:hypothetical protein